MKARSGSDFHARDRFNVSGMSVGDICFACECRVFAIAGEGIAFAWCECAFPEDAREMEVLSQVAAADQKRPS